MKHGITVGALLTSALAGQEHLVERCGGDRVVVPSSATCALFLRERDAN